MRMYYIVNARLPTGQAHGIQIAKMCDAFTAQGIHLTLVLPRRRGARGSLEKEYRLSRPITVVRLPVLDFIGLIPGVFALETVSFALAVRLWLLFRPAGVIYTRGEMPLFLAAFLPRRFVLVWETHIKPQNTRRYQHAVDRCNLLLAATKAYAAEIPKLWNVPAEKVLYEPDGVALSDFAQAPQKSEARNLLKLPQDKKIALYAGSDAPWKGVALLQRAAELLPGDFLTVFVGKIAGENSTKKFFAGSQPYAQIPVWLSAADAFVLTGDPQSETAKRYTSPLKLFEYMAAERPIVAVNLPAYRDVLSPENAFLAAPEPEALATQIQTAVSSEGEGRAREARAAAAQYDWRERASRIMARIRTSI